MQTNVHNVSVPMIKIFLSLSDVCLALVVHTDRKWEMRPRRGEFSLLVYA